ncbi:hypothetical protein COU61_01600, partial [Candidatus Pacearchaeota archaeon CG10_big_fil_rev_8_21_14_0_10_35_13]
MNHEKRLYQGAKGEVPYERILREQLGLEEPLDYRNNKPAVVVERIIERLRPYLNEEGAITFQDFLVAVYGTKEPIVSMAVRKPLIESLGSSGIRISILREVVSRIFPDFDVLRASTKSRKRGYRGFKGSDRSASLLSCDNEGLERFIRERTAIKEKTIKEV